MGKHHRNTKQAVVRNNSSQGAVIEKSEVFDDSLLPDAEEIRKLHELDPNILEWLKIRAEKEQDFRHTAFSERSNIISQNEQNTRRINVLGMCFAFVIMMTGMFYSAYALTLGHNLSGTIFGGSTLLMAGVLFVTRKIKIDKASDDK